MVPEIPLSAKAAQLVFPGFSFGLDDPALAERLVDLGAGGFCLYGGAAAEVDELTRRLQARARLPLLFCADYEDGLAGQVPEGTGLPTNMAIGASADESLAYQKGLLTAVEARAIGVRWVFAPVVDLATEPTNPIVNVRSFGADPKLAGSLAAAYAKGMASERVLACAKHFPGHGETTGDSHLELPTLRLSTAELMRREIEPYRVAAGPAGSVMTAHLYVPELCDDPKVPTSLSAKTVSLLRDGVGFQGLVTTDALNMGAVAANYSSEEACLAALRAGNDVLLAPADPKEAVAKFSARASTEAALAGLVEAAFERVMTAKQFCGLWKDKGLAPEGSRTALGSIRHREAAERMAAACIVGIGPEIKAGRAVRYLEPESESPAEWQGRAFVEELKAQGFEVLPYSAEGASTVIVAVFVRPRPYSGQISLFDKEARQAQSALASASDSILVSFGSPFVLEQVRSWRHAVCAFGSADCLQKAAARVVSGKGPATGQLPVALRTAS